MIKVQKRNAYLLTSYLCMSMLGGVSVLNAETPLQKIPTVPNNGLNVDWPVLKDAQYFTYKGRNARSVTLRSIMAFDCHRIMNLYDKDPQLALDDVGLLILVQFSLRGLDIQSMHVEKREGIAIAEIAKRLRQFGRIAEVKALFQTPRVIPSVAGLCQIVAEHKEDLLRQKYHVTQQWDRHKLALADLDDTPVEEESVDEEEESDGSDSDVFESDTFEGDPSESEEDESDTSESEEDEEA